MTTILAKYVKTMDSGPIEFRVFEDRLEIEGNGWVETWDKEKFNTVAEFLVQYLSDLRDANEEVSAKSGSVSDGTGQDGQDNCVDPQGAD